MTTKELIIKGIELIIPHLDIDKYDGGQGTDIKSLGRGHLIQNKAGGKPVVRLEDEGFGKINLVIMLAGTLSVDDCTSCCNDAKKILNPIGLYCTDFTVGTARTKLIFNNRYERNLI